MTIKFGYAGDRNISVKILEFLLKNDNYPSCLLVSDNVNATDSEHLVSRCPFLERDLIIPGSKLPKKDTKSKLSSLNLDYLICIHFPYIIPESILSIPKIGVLNLHPAYLPWNRGWHTPTWAIFDNTPFGATLHFMDTSLDTGDIIHEKKLPISLEDTADSLYQKVLDLEIEVFTEAFPKILQKNFTRIPQKNLKGSVHKKNDIKNIQKIDLNENAPIKDLIIKLKALTTNTIDEAAFFEENGEIYQVQIKIIKQDKELK